MGKMLQEYLIREDLGTHGHIYLYNQDGTAKILDYGSNPQTLAENSPVSLEEITAIPIRGSKKIEETADYLIGEIAKTNPDINYRDINYVSTTLYDKLNATFVYPEVIKREARKKTDHSVHHFETHEVRPTLEVLFFERQDLFLKLVAALIQRNDDRLYTSFLNCVKNTALAEEPLFRTDQRIKENIEKIMAKLTSHAQVITEEAPLKAAAITALTQKVTSQLEHYNAGSTGKEYLAKQFQALKIKLVLLKTLAQPDKALTLSQRSYGYNPKNAAKNYWGYYTSRTLNTLSVLLCGLPFLINRVISGNWFFFSHTTTEEYLAQAKKTLLAAEEELKFKAPPSPAVSLPPSIPLSALSEAPNPKWTASDECHYQQMLDRLSTAEPGQFQENEADKEVIEALTKAYLLSGSVEFYQKITAIYNVNINIYSQQNAGDVEKTLQAMETVYPLSLNGKINSLRSKYPQENQKLEQQLRAALERKFGPNAISASLLDIYSAHIYDAPKGLSYKDTKDKPFISLSTLAYPKYIDAVLTRVDAKAYETAKQDAQFQNLMLELVNQRKRLTFHHALVCLPDIYRGSFARMDAAPHLYHHLHHRISIYPNNLAQFLPHPFLLKAAKLILKKSIFEQGSHVTNKILSPLIGGLLVSEKYPEFKDWSLLPKTGGKDAGFILESPDSKERLYVKCTDNMINELLAAKMLNHLGIKMAEASLLATDEGNLFFVTRNLSRQYQTKQKLFKPFCEVLPEPIAYNMEPQFEQYGSKEEQENKQRTFSQHLFSDSAGITKISFAKLLLAGLALGLSDLGGHGGNIGPLVSEKNGIKKQKLGLVDYQVCPEYFPSMHAMTLQNLHSKVNDYASHMAPLFKGLAKQLTLQDIQKALEQLQLPRCYATSREGYFFKQDKQRQSYLLAIELAYKETLTELKALGVLTEKIEFKLRANKEFSLNNFKMMIGCLELGDAKPAPSDEEIQKMHI